MNGTNNTTTLTTIFGNLAKTPFHTGRSSRGFAIEYVLVSNEIDILNGESPDTGLSPKMLEPMAQACVFGREYFTRTGKEIKAVSNHLIWLISSKDVVRTASGYRVNLEKHGDFIRDLQTQVKPVQVKPVQVKPAKAKVKK